MTLERRSLVGRLLLSVNVLLANAAALFCVVVFLDPTVLGFGLPGQRVVVLQLDSTAAWVAFVLALCLLAGNLLWLARRPRGPRPRNYVVSEAPGGRVRISREALESGLRSAGEALAEITRLRVVVDPGHGRRLVVHGQFQCPEGISNLEASRLLREALARRFEEMVRLPEGSRAEFDLEFVGFSGKPPKRGSGEPAPGAEPAPFTGPRYPIEDEADR